MVRSYRLFVIGLLLLAIFTGSVIVRAQDGSDDEKVAQELEALALVVHQHNMRSGDFTVWTGGEMGNPDYGLRPAFELGTKLTDWELPGFDSTQKAFSGRDIKSPTLLNLWASWCWPCVQEIPDVVDIALHPDDHAYQVIFADSIDDPSMAQEFVSQLPDGLHILVDANGDLLNKVGSPGIPTSILFGSDGTVLAIHIGSFTPAHQRLFDLIAQHPDLGSFDAADYPDLPYIADIQPASADDALPIPLDEPVHGTIDDDTTQQVYRFDGHAGDVVSIQMQQLGNDISDMLEPYLVLLAPDGTRLGETLAYADSLTELNPITLPADGVYLIVATRFLEADGLSAGPYRLTLNVQ